MLTLAKKDFPEPSSTFWVSLRYLSLTRLVIAEVLLGAVLMFGSASDFGSTDSSLFVRTAIVYAVLGTLLAYFALSRQQGFYAQLGAQLVLDVAALTVMLHASEGTRGGIAVLFLLPIAGTAILSPPLFAAFFAAIFSRHDPGRRVWDCVFHTGRSDESARCARDRAGTHRQDTLRRLAEPD